MTVLPHRHRLQYGSGITGPYSPEKADAFKKKPAETNRNRDLAFKLLERRRLARANDDSVDAVMNRGDDTDRFHYFGEGERS